MKKYLLLTIIVLLAACKQATVPTEYTKSDQLPEIYPDYIDVTVPVNIAPLTFELLPSPAKKADFTQMVARYSFDGDEIVVVEFLKPFFAVVFMPKVEPSVF